MVIKVTDDIDLLDSMSLPHYFAGQIFDALIAMHLDSVYYIDPETGFSFSEELVSFKLTPNEIITGEARQQFNTTPKNDI